MSFYLQVQKERRTSTIERSDEFIITDDVQFNGQINRRRIRGIGFAAEAGFESILLSDSGTLLWIMLSVKWNSY